MSQAQELPEDFKADMREFLPDVDLDNFHESLIEVLSRPKPAMTDEDHIKTENILRERFGLPKRVIPSQLTQE